ncbi:MULTISPECIES: pentapeptide repeat-containing protein [unclassified Streptomyces]|uniref:pentapeptide repeat-containing protein n=1 Tax=unclassified Streptomyces TaxID=2593676 RepID=UPI00336AB701
MSFETEGAGSAGGCAMAVWVARVAAYGLAVVSGVLLVVAVFSWDRLVDLAGRIPPVPLVLVLASLACAVAAGELYRRTRLHSGRFVPPIRWWWVLLASAAVLVAVWATTALLLSQTTHTQSVGERTKLRIEVVRTGLAAGAGAGAALTVLLAFRRQFHHEKATEETEHDAAERRITELYTKAVEQLGGEQAPVRLGGLYALERLGQTAPGHRQTIVDVICAYLRMPYAPPERTAPATELPPQAVAHADETDNQRRQELQVRLTAQRILTAHLAVSRHADQRETTAPDPRFWEGIRIDLSNATLSDSDFRNWHVAEATFDGATFTDYAFFGDATFNGKASFLGAVFTNYAFFGDATFTGDANFGGHPFFGPTTFAAGVDFDGATFAGGVYFDGTTFTGNTSFDGVRVRDLEAMEDFPPLGWYVVPTPDGGGIVRRYEEPG